MDPQQQSVLSLTKDLCGGPSQSKARGAMNPLDVLVVDDDENARELMEMAVLSFGHQCRVAVDGNDALRLLRLGFRP